MPNDKKSYRLLLIDKDAAVHTELGMYFLTTNLKMYSAYNARQAVEIIRFNPPDIILLETDMTDTDGIRFCSSLREKSEVPIIIVSCRGSEADRLAGLAAGADDYIVKPYSKRELDMRIRIVLRRAERSAGGADSPTRIRAGNITIDRNRYVANVNGRDISCTAKEMEILWILVSNQGMVFSREHLLSVVWGSEYTGDDRAIDSHIKRLRAKLADPRNNWAISTVWGIGYRFELL